MDQRLQKLRKRIDSCDDILVKVLGLRFQIISEVAELKKDLKIPSLDTERFSQVLHRTKNIAVSEGLDPNLIEEILNPIHKYSLEKIKKWDEESR